MSNKYVLSAAFAIFIVFMSYIVNFYFILNQNISSDTSVWGQLGDYAGGLLNPILSFFSLVLLIKSLTLQNEANVAIRKELKNNEKTEKLRTFETQFFNMINSQKLLFDSFKIEIRNGNGVLVKEGVKAVIEIEDEIERLRGVNKNDDEIYNFINKLDSSDKIFGSTRSFYVIVKMISEKLSDVNGFTANERRSHLLTLVNFTDFSLLRLIMISMQFMDYQSTEYLKNDREFNSVLEEVGLSWKMY